MKPPYNIVAGLLLLGVASITSIQYNEHQTDNNHALYELNVFNNTSMMTSIPHFDYKASPKNITVALGATAYLVCCIRNLGKNTVSWIRHRDINLLSVGKLKYTQDQRYQIFHNNINDTWTLKVCSLMSHFSFSPPHRHVHANCGKSLINFFLLCEFSFIFTAD